MKVDYEKLEPLPDQELYDKIAQAKLQILGKSPFFAEILYGFVVDLDATSNCKTAYTNGKGIYFYPKFLSILSIGETEFVLLHEIMHIVLGHCYRNVAIDGVGLDHNLLNIAADKIVNSLIADEFGLDKIIISSISDEPSMHIVNDGKYNYEASKFSFDQVIKYEQQNGDVQSKGFDDHSQWGSLSESEDSMLSEKAKDIIKKAATKSGDGLSHHLKDAIDEIFDKTLNYKQILRNFLRSTVKDDYSFNPPDSRYQGDFFIPSFKSPQDEFIRLLVWVDTSGSLNIDHLKLIFNEIKGVMNQFNGNLELTVGTFCTEVNSVDKITNAKDLYKIKRISGGTDFYAPFEYTRDLKNKPDAVIFFTDGFAAFPPKEMLKGIPLLWILDNKHITPPYGLVARMLNNK